MHLTKLRELLLTAPTRPDRPSHLSAASGLVRVNDDIYVVADDEYHLGRFSIAGDSPGNLIRLLPGDLPLVEKKRKKMKPDFEVLALLGPSACPNRGALLALGSGSKDQRRRGVLLPLGTSEPDLPRSSVVDASALYAAAGQAVHKLNIEGAVIIEDRLVLLHRGNRKNSPNALLTFDLRAALDSLADEDSPPPPLLASQSFDLGEIGGVPFGFTDGAALPDGTLVFSAVAEDTDDNYADGPCVGAVIGLIRHGKLVVLRRLDKPHKVEGIHAEIEGKTIRLLLVTDADDASVPASLYSAELRL